MNCRALWVCFNYYFLSMTAGSSKILVYNVHTMLILLKNRQFSSNLRYYVRYYHCSQAPCLYWRVVCLFACLFRFFIRCYLHLHFKCYPLSSFCLQKPPIPVSLSLLPNPMIHNFTLLLGPMSMFMFLWLSFGYHFPFVIYQNQVIKLS